jgi:hypothetical protein
MLVTLSKFLSFNTEDTALFFMEHHGQCILPIMMPWTTRLRTTRHRCSICNFTKSIVKTERPRRVVKRCPDAPRCAQMRVAKSFVGSCMQHTWTFAEAKSEALNCCSRQLCIRILCKMSLGVGGSAVRWFGGSASACRNTLQNT